MDVEIKEELEQIKQSLTQLGEAFDQKIKTDKWKNEKYDEMHSRMLEYQNGIVEKSIDPILKSLITLADGIRKDKASFENDDNGFTDYLDGIIDHIENLLFDYDVEPYKGPDVFDPKLQSISKTIKVEESEKDKQIQAVICQGYQRNDKVFRIEKVNIYKFEKEGT